MSIVLASASPRRLELLRSLGLTFVTRPSNIDEEAWQLDNPADLARELGLEKARAARRPDDSWVIGADTVVAIDDIVFGKPTDQAENRRMLQRLSGTEHSVYGSIALINGKTGIERCEVVHTLVQFHQLDEATLTYYLSTGDGMDKAGGYGIQGLGAIMVEAVRGCYDNVVGLSRSRLYHMLHHEGVLPPQERAHCAL
ncbi:Maf family protein [Desulfurispira natronophila]|uniref:dTTP/UTP pyrophosphatase n=1 Tax=Desulfurispira natronophila TaxID=682562 RepID=A0A7W7Y588_9BACT|nr:Maf family protein [Desulfurispira natronophila]MBB5022325.1 septum formation protein [Desulfurispira natronophila]